VCGVAVSFVASKSARASFEESAAALGRSAFTSALDAIEGTPRSADSRAAATVPE
jgi:hypothetical protein